MAEMIKIRIAHGRLTAIGPGKADLLDAIHKSGSISAAARSMGMSYRRAWELVDAMNRCFQQPLVVTSPGGVHGGGAQVTEYGFHILRCYRDLVGKAHAAAAFEISEIYTQLKQED